MPETYYYRSGQASKLLQISSRDMRRLCELGMIEAEFSDGRQWRIPTSEIERLQRQGVPPIPRGEISPEHELNGRTRAAGLLAAPSEDAIDAADEVVRLESQVQSLGLKRQIEEQQDWFRERERQTAARKEAQLQQMETDRHNSERRRGWEEWRDECLAQAMRLRSSDIPKEADLDIAREVTLVLENLGPDSPEFFVRRQVEGAAQKALRPYQEARDTETAIQEACTSSRIPYQFQSKDDFQGRARLVARSEIEKLPPESSRLEKLQAAHGAAQQVLREVVDAQAAEALLRSRVMALAGATAEEEAEAAELAQAAIQGISGRREREAAIDEALKPLRETLRERQDRQAREWVMLLAPFPRLPEEAIRRARAEIEETLRKMRGASRREMEQARDEIIERFERANALAQKKQQLIDSALGGVYGYLVELHNEYKLGPRDPSPREVERRVKETVRQRLEALLTGSETAEAVGKRVRALVRRELDIQ